MSEVRLRARHLDITVDCTDRLDSQETYDVSSAGRKTILTQLTPTNHILLG